MQPGPPTSQWEPHRLSSLQLFLSEQERIHFQQGYVATELMVCVRVYVRTVC